MAFKPHIVFIGNAADKDILNVRIEALEKGLDLQYNCDMLCFTSLDSFLYSRRHNPRLLKDDRLVGVIVDKDYDDEDEDFLRVIATIRVDRPDLAILVYRGYALAETEKNVFDYEGDLPEIAPFINQWKQAKAMQFDHFNASGRSEVDFVSNQLLASHRKQYSDDNRCISDDQSRITLQAIRVRICPAECLTKEYDDHFDRTVTELSVVDRKTYEDDLKSVRLLCQADQTALRELLHQSTGSTENGSVGDLLLGFAVDLDTGIYSTSGGFAGHETALKNVEITLSHYYLMLGEDHQTADELVENSSIIYGLIYQNVGRLTTPIAVFRLDLDESEARKLSEFLSRTRIAIPICLLWDNFSMVGEDPDKPKRP